MGLLEGLYAKSPISLQVLMVHAWGVAWYLRRYGSHYRAKVLELEANERLSGPELAQLQLRALNALLQHARRAPYYAELFSKVGFTPPVESIEELRRLPTLSKQVLRARPRDLLTRRPPRGTRIFRSSGTTGTPTDIYFTRRFHQERMAYLEARVRRWAGTRLGDRRAMFGVRKVCGFDQARPPFWRRSLAENLTYYSIYHLSPRFMPCYVADLEAFRPRVIMGYPSALGLLARHVLHSGQRLPIPVAVTTSETVSPDTRAAIEAAFGARLFDEYGAVEGTHVASQCEHGSYHLSPELGILEMLDEGDRPCAPGVEGRVVVTGLGNDLQPLIRYELGDVAAWAVDQQCPCGRPFPILEGVAGRYEDYCVTPDGRRVLRFDTVFKGVSAILEGQVVQRALDRFTIRVVPTPAFSERDRETLRQNMAAHAGDVQVDIELVAAIERTAAGKFRAVVNLMESHR